MVVESAHPTGHTPEEIAHVHVERTPQSHTRTANADRPLWLDREEVTQLREWATDKVYPLPGAEVSEATIGSAAPEKPSDIQLVDPQNLLSRRHARLVRRGAFWLIEDLRSKNGTHQDGNPNPRFRILPGGQIGLGGVTLVGENQTQIELRSYLKRCLGWTAATWPAIDVALCAIRTAAERRAPLVIAGDDDLVAIAYQIHRRGMSPSTPFVVCGPRRQSDVSLRVTATHADPVTALAHAAGGTVCVRAEQPPAGLHHLTRMFREQSAPAQLIICAGETSKRAAVAPSIIVPQLTRRPTADVHRIVFDYALDAIDALGAKLASFTEADRERVVAQEAKTWADIEIATLRIVARKYSGSVHGAAERLGISHAGLGKWLKRRRT
jgi:hypothetical protein